MANLINARAFRLGISVQWSDVWYVKWFLYSDIVERLLKIRYYFVFFFTQKFFEKKSYFYSNLRILKFYKTFFINIYTYYGRGLSFLLKLNKYYKASWLNYFKKVKRYRLDSKSFLPLKQYSIGWVVTLMYIMVLESVYGKYSIFKQRRDINRKEYNIEKKKRISEYFRLWNILKKDQNLYWDFKKKNILEEKKKEIKFLFLWVKGIPISRFLKSVFKHWYILKRWREYSKDLKKLLWKDKKNSFLSLKKKKTIKSRAALYSKASRYMTLNAMRKYKIKKRLKRTYYVQINDFLFKLKQAFSFGNVSSMKDVLAWKYRQSSLKKSFPSKRFFTFKSLLFYILYLTLTKDLILDKSHQEDKLNSSAALGGDGVNLALENLFFTYTVNFNLAGLFNLIARELEYVTYLLTQLKVNVNVYLINNTGVNSRFLTRYFTKKLSKGVGMWSLINPIGRSLLLAARKKEKSGLSWFKNTAAMDVWNSLERKFYFKELWVNLLYFLMNSDNKYHWEYMDKKFSFYSLYNFSLAFWVREVYKSRKSVIILWQRFIKQQGLWKIVKVGSIASLQEILSSMFFAFSFLKDREFINTSMKGKLPLSPIYNFLFFEYFVGNLKEGFLGRSTWNIPLEDIRGVTLQLNRVLTYNYLHFNYDSLSASRGVSKLKERLKKMTSNSWIIGFKFRLAGRFSRKQRAKKYWIARGQVPLSSVKSYIDYSWHSLPLINSAVSVKIWLYRNKDIYKNYGFKLGNTRSFL